MSSLLTSCNYLDEIQRINSFVTSGWPLQATEDYNIGARDLARWGFYYRGYLDAVRCAYCRLGVQGWASGDTAESEHRRWNPACSFLRMPQVQTGAFSHYGSRLPTFHNWPQFLTGPILSPETLARSGFLYLDRGDIVSCYQCGIALNNWSQDDCPNSCHAIWSPTCSALIALVGQEFISNLQGSRQKDLKMESHNKIVEIYSGVENFKAVAFAINADEMGHFLTSLNDPDANSNDHIFKPASGTRLG